MPHDALDHLSALIGEWQAQGTHPYLPGADIRGRATFEWLGEQRFLIWRAAYEHPQIPDSIAILGCDESTAGSGPCAMHYFDERGVSRQYSFSAAPAEWRLWRDSPDFSQRMAFTISADGQTMQASGELSRDGTTWEPDLQLTYTRAT